MHQYDKCDDKKNSFYEYPVHVFDQFPTYNIQILLNDFNVKFVREDIFKPTTGNKSLHKTSKDNGVRIVNSATSDVKITISPQGKIHTYTWTSPDGKTHNRLIISQQKEGNNQVYLMSKLLEKLPVVLAIIWWFQNFGKGYL
jgi:hypothetical protein